MMRQLGIVALGAVVQYRRLHGIMTEPLTGARSTFFSLW